MAQTERRSKPRKAQHADEKPEPKGQGLVLLAYLVGAIGIVVGMIIIAVFLSDQKNFDMTLLYALAGLAVVSAALFIWGKVRLRQTA